MQEKPGIMHSMTLLQIIQTLQARLLFAISNSYPNLITSTYQTDNIMAGFNNENFESSFPPAGWSIINPDNGFTFEWSPVCNGPTFPVQKQLKMNFMIMHRQDKWII